MFLLRALLFAGIAIAGVCLLDNYLDSVINRLKESIRKISQNISGVIKKTRVFVKEVLGGIEETYRHSYKDRYGNLHEMIESRVVSASEVPEEIRMKAYRANESVEITDQVEMRLELS